VNNFSGRDNAERMSGLLRFAQSTRDTLHVDFSETLG
jgi:hypothetical protein